MLSRITLCRWTLPWLCAGSVLAGPHCPQTPVRVDFLEFGVFYKSTRNAMGTGIDRDLVDELSKRSGCSFDGKVQARARTWLELKAGNVDMTTSGVRTEEREAFFWFLPYHRTHHVVLLGSAAPPSVNTLAEFEANPTLKVGVVRGFKHSSFYDPLIAKWAQAGRVIEHVDEALLMGALQRGEVAAVVSSAGVYHLYTNAETGPHKLRVMDWDPGNMQVIGNLVLSKARFDQAEATKWGLLLKDMQRDGSLLRIFRKYVSAEEAQSMLP
jgi:polar amino acid transport system substrate-binding protein